jgi:ABC-type multidrug transport system fused ATPase/permease subunit
MVNVVYVVPRITSFRQVLHEIFEARAVRTPNGDATQVSKSKPSLTVGLGYVDPSGEINGGESYTFGDQAGELASVAELIAAAGVNVVAAWEAAFDAAKELFEKTQDQDASAASVGVKWFMRVDIVEANLHPSGPMGLKLVIGCYRDAAFTKVAASFEIGFFDSATMNARADQIAALEKNLAALAEMIAGTHVTQLDLSGDALRDSKTRAANDLVINQMQLAKLEAALAAPLSRVLTVPAVQTAFAAVSQAVFTELQAKLPEWSDIDVAEVMSFFGPALASVVAA